MNFKHPKFKHVLLAIKREIVSVEEQDYLAPDLIFIYRFKLYKTKNNLLGFFWPFFVVVNIEI